MSNNATTTSFVIVTRKNEFFVARRTTGHDDQFHIVARCENEFAARMVRDALAAKGDADARPRDVLPDEVWSQSAAWKRVRALNGE